MHSVWFYLQHLSITLSINAARLHNHKIIETGLDSQAIEKEKKRKDYTFRRQFNEKPSIIPGCPDHRLYIWYKAQSA